MVTKPRTVYTCPDGTDFPVDWDNPADEEHGWWWDQMHGPLPLSRLCHDMWPDILNGFNRTADLVGAPVFTARKYANGYMYSRGLPFDDDPRVRAAVRARDSERRMDRVLDLWHTEYRPEVEALTRSIRALAEAPLSLAQLVERLDQVHAARRRQGEIHMLVMGQATNAGNRFIDFCKQEFGADGEALASDLMKGFPNKSLESAQGLWRLSREAKARPEVEALLRSEPPGDFIAQVGGVAGGVEFAALLREYLEVYGHRNESFSELSFPTWREDPRFPLFIIRRYVASSEDASPTALHEKTVARRLERLKEAEARVGNDVEKLERFHAWMKSAQQRTVLLEDHNFYIDQQGPAATRSVCMAIGRHLVEMSLVDRPDDVFHLSEEDVRRASAGLVSDFRPLVEERRQERERWLRVLPPAVIGKGSVDLGPMERFFGPIQVEPATASEVFGVAGSPGQMRGVARLVLTLDDVDRLSPGEVLVTYATAPPWTPLFAVAGAVVTDTGGLLSHCAVVAREYGIPAVVGTKVATARIEDGMVITVDGTRGVVSLET